jgi:hypothetical protein
MFQRNMPSPFLGSKSTPYKKSQTKMEETCSSESQLIFNGLYGVISEKIILFITTAVRTSNPTT